MMDAEQFIRWYIDTWEGGLSLNPKDHGNYWNGRLVGSKYGVTAGAYSMWSGKKDITPDTIKNITEDQAVSIGKELFYLKPRINWLPWNAVSASLTDKCWGSGNIPAVKILQKMIGVPQDGYIGSTTVHAFTDFLARHGEEQAAIMFGKAREDHDEALHQSDFTRGWNNRTEGFLPGTAFWSLFHAE